MSKPISQREARRLKKEAEALRDKLKAAHDQYTAGYPGGFHIASFTPSERIRGRIEAGKMLGVAFVGKWDGTGLLIYMVPKP